MKANDWFTGLPSWIQPDKSWYERMETSNRSTSSASTSKSASVGASTKRRSRADAMRCLEGREQSFMSASSNGGQLRHRANKHRDDGESEDEDPWTDPWAEKQFAASSLYSDRSDLHSLVPDTASMGSGSQRENRVLPLKYKACHHMGISEASHRLGVVNSGSMGANVKAALRPSSYGSNSSSEYSEPKLPPTVHLSKDVSSRRPRSNFWPPKDRRSHSHGRGSLYAPSAEPYIPMKNTRTSKVNDPNRTVWSHDPSHLHRSPTVPTPKNTYHQDQHRPVFDHATVLYDVELDQQTAIAPSKHLSMVDFEIDISEKSQTWVQALIGFMVAVNCFGTHHTRHRLSASTSGTCNDYKGAFTGDHGCNDKYLPSS